MKASEAKQLRCACLIKKNVACNRKASITFRIETDDGTPEFMTFCQSHIRIAEMAIRELCKVYEQMQKGDKNARKRK